MTMKCPRRDEGSPFKFPEKDHWGGDDTCSYCGSFNPDALMARLEKGDVKLVPTDKSYKVYVYNEGGEKFKSWHSRKCPDVMTCDRQTCEHWTKDDARDQTKFYFMHLSEEQMRRFVDLLNEKKLKMGEPGHFYVRPYFCAVAS